MQTTAQKWLLGMIALGAAYLAFTNPKGVYAAAQSVQTAVGGTETEIITGGRG